MATNKQIGGHINKLKIAIDILGNRTFCVLTGAGISTDSGIPDYRGRGSAPQKPLNYKPFMRNADYRRDFWIEGYQDWLKFCDAKPNSAHKAIAQLEQDGIVSGVITQNVDALHRKAKSKSVAELHGNMFVTECLYCTNVVLTREVIDKMEMQNPSLLTRNVDRKNFQVPRCELCGSLLKPIVTFFGEGLRDKPFGIGADIAENADAMVIAGTSLNVMSPIGFVNMMVAEGKPVIVINNGPTLVDKIADVKVEMNITEAFAGIMNSSQSKVYI
jgi:NAD-dependent SIR2 family protein deacetylase